MPVITKQTRTIWEGSGRGTLTLTTTLDPTSALPTGAPTYASLACDGKSVYAGGWNTTRTDGSAIKRIPYAGEACRLRLRADQSSAVWEGTDSWILYQLRDERTGPAGEAVVVKGPWRSRAVTSAGTFSFGDQSGLDGTITVKATSCSTDGGDTDTSATDACAGLVQKNTDARARIVVRDDAGVLFDRQIEVTYTRHHETFTWDLPRPITGELCIEVSRTSGAPLLVHGPNTRLVGMRA